MARCPHRLPGFKTTFVGVGVLHVLLGASILTRGVRESLAPFAVPEVALNSPHYADAIFWVYSHQIVIGLAVVLLGVYARGARFQLAASRLFLVAHAYYTWLDFRASDSIVGTGLYHGRASLVPAFITLAFTLAFLHLSFCSHTRQQDRDFAREN
jgi:hypothetical protein